MKTKQKNLYCIFVAITLIMLSSCSDDIPVVENTPTQRGNQKMDELYDVLTSSSEGWKLVYYPNDELYGGFTFIFKFKDRKNVETISDFANPDQPPTVSEYRILWGSSLKLSFVTRNDLHRLADSNNSPESDGRGYQGDFEFLYQGKSGEDLLFKTNRVRKNVRFQKASKQDAEDMKKIQVMVDNMNLNRRSVFTSCVQRDNLGEEKYCHYDYARRFMTLKTADNDVSFAILPTTEGFSRSIADGGASFVYNPERIEFYAAQPLPAMTVTLRATNRPQVMTDDYKRFDDINSDEGFLNFVYVLGVSDGAPQTSSAFNDMMRAAKEQTDKVAPYSWKRVYIRLGDKDNGPYIEYRFTNTTTDNAERVYRDFAYQVQNGVLVFTPTFWSSSRVMDEQTEQQLVDALKPVDDFFMNREGLYMEETARYAFSNTPFSFTNLANPAQRGGGFFSF